MGSGAEGEGWVGTNGRAWAERRLGWIRLEKEPESEGGNEGMASEDREGSV